MNIKTQTKKKQIKRNQEKKKARQKRYQIINEKINYIRKLENQIFNKRGKYLGIGETFISHIEVRAKIQKNKEEVKKQGKDIKKLSVKELDDIYNLVKERNKCK